jgi:hypothetical protein
MIVRYETTDGKKFDNKEAAEAHERTLVETQRDKTTFKYGEVMAVLTDAAMRDNFKKAIDHYLANAPKKEKPPRKPRKSKAERDAEKAAAAAAGTPAVAGAATTAEAVTAASVLG